MGNNRVSKRDGLGRRDADKERRWRGLIGKQNQIGQSVRGFCREQGLKEASFYRWRQVIRRPDRETMQAEASTSALAPVVVIEEPGNASSHSERSVTIEILLRGGTTIRVPCGSTGEQLAMVLDVLERSRC